MYSKKKKEKLNLVIETSAPSDDIEETRGGISYDDLVFNFGSGIKTKILWQNQAGATKLTFKDKSFEEALKEYGEDSTQADVLKENVENSTELDVLKETSPVSEGANFQSRFSSLKSLRASPSNSLDGLSSSLNCGLTDSYVGSPLNKNRLK